MSPFSVHRQGKVTKLKEVTFDASEFEVKAGEQPALDSEIANMVYDAVVSHLNNKLEFVGQNLHSMFDARFSQIETHLGMSPISDDKYASTSNTNRTMGNSAGDGIQTDAIVMSSAKQSSGRTNGTTPYHKILYNSTPNANVPPQGAPSSLRHVSTPPNFTQPNGRPVPNWPNTDDFGSDSIKKEVIKIFRQSFGIEPKVKCRTYQRPYPENYDYVAYP